MGGVNFRYVTGGGKRRGADNFNRANGALGPNWLLGAGSDAQIVNNTMQIGTPGTGGIAAWVPANPTATRGIARCTWVSYVGVEWGGPMVLEHVNGINNDSYVFKAEDLGGGEPRGQITIIRRFAGANLQLAIATPVQLAGFLFGGIQALEWIVQPTQTILNAYVNGILQCTGIDNTGNQFTQGKPGIGVATFSGALNAWDNFSYESNGGSVGIQQFGVGV